MEVFNLVEMVMKYVCLLYRSLFPRLLEAKEQSNEDLSKDFEPWSATHHITYFWFLRWKLSAWFPEVAIIEPTFASSIR